LLLQLCNREAIIVRGIIASKTSFIFI